MDCMLFQATIFILFDTDVISDNTWYNEPVRIAKYVLLFTVIVGTVFIIINDNNHKWSNLYNTKRQSEYSANLEIIMSWVMFWLLWVLLF